ncbi:MAG TPA: cation:proton antiporter [Kiritimatiellia bacterium]|nr:cation:proton antiporter [Kiritimatiellia bacterium]HRZ11006.1 cation:proton antiporter [Kiritimatiellia bacterium]HSA18579.1 cation:proton antiporter [Kiritimatiellia bacterium]
MAPSLIQDLAVILLISGLTTWLFHVLNQPKVVGYVLAGILIGPHTPPFALIQDEATIRTLADIGIIFLMFSLGLDFNLRRLRRVGATAVLTAILDVSVMIWLGFLLGRKLGWTPLESLFLGAILCDSSTTILAKILHEMGRSHDRFAGVAIGITVVEDVLAVGMIAVLTGLALTGSVQTGLVAVRLWHLVLFLVLVTVAGLLTVPRLLDRIHRFRNDEVLIVVLVGLCFGVSLLAVRLELSLALGAVLVGALASESHALPRISALVEPLRHVFSAVFFVTIGLRLDPLAVWAHLPTLGAVVLLVMGGKLLTNATGCLLTGHPLDTSLLVGAGMAQIGEFAFIISALALSLHAGREIVYQVGVSAAVLTTLLNPYLLRVMDRSAGRLARSPRGRRWRAGIYFYSQWIAQVGQRGQNRAVRRVVRRSLLVVSVNLILIAAIFGVAGYVQTVTAAAGERLLGRPGLYAALLWLAAAATSLPLYVVTARKLAALALMLAETALPATLTAGWVRPVRTFITHALLLASGIGLVLLTFMLSSTLLPSREVFVLLVLLTLASTVWAHRQMARVYARAQAAIQTLLSSDRKQQPPDRQPILPDLAYEMELVPLVLPPSRAEPGARTLRTLKLRTRTGATIVAFERDGRRIINPDPDTEFQAGDRIFLLGLPDQVRSARELLDRG